MPETHDVINLPYQNEPYSITVVYVKPAARSQEPVSRGQLAEVGMYLTRCMSELKLSESRPYTAVAHLCNGRKIQIATSKCAKRTFTLKTETIFVTNRSIELRDTKTNTPVRTRYAYNFMDCLGIVCATRKDTIVLLPTCYKFDVQPY